MKGQPYASLPGRSGQGACQGGKNAPCIDELLFGLSAALRDDLLGEWERTFLLSCFGHAKRERQNGRAWAPSFKQERKLREMASDARRRRSEPSMIDNADH